MNYLRNLEDKKSQVLSSIEEQGKLTEALRKEILDAQTMVAVEDLYRPYRPKRRTRATIAKEKGLEGLANLVMLQMADRPVEELARDFLSEEKDVKTVEDAVDGAKDIIAEYISDEADYRTYIRKVTMSEGKIVSKAKDEQAQSVYEMYYDFEEAVHKMAGHRVLAVNRGENEKFLTVKEMCIRDRYKPGRKAKALKFWRSTENIWMSSIKYWRKMARGRLALRIFARSEERREGKEC